MLLARNRLLNVAMAARGRQLLLQTSSAAVAERTRRTYAENATRCNKTDGESSDFQVDKQLQDLTKLLNAYKETDFEETLYGAPKHAFWTAVVSTVPLVAKTLVVLVTLHCDGDYPTVVAGYVSMYVAAANAWWWRWSVDSSNDSSSFLQIQRALAPTTICAAAVAFLPSFAGLSVMAVGYASFRMVCRLVVRENSCVPRPWGKSLVLLVFGVCAPCLATALICSAFNR